jgi:hypothetical protein
MNKKKLKIKGFKSFTLKTFEITGVTKRGNKMNKKKNHVLVAVILTALVFIPASASVEGENTVMQEINTRGTAKLTLNFGKFPLYFIANKWQVNEKAKFKVKKNNNGDSDNSPGYNLNNSIADQYNIFQLNQFLNHQYLQPLFLSNGLEQNTHLLSDDFNLQPLPRPKKQPGRAMLFGLGQMLCLSANYWVQPNVMRDDWEYQFTWEDQKKRLLFIDGLRFDSNTFNTNWTHSLGGALCYNYGRANRLNPLESFLYSFGASYFWEFVIEFKEVVSINDMITTPMGGASIGEALFQLGRYFRSRKPNIFNRVLRILSDPVLSMHEWVDRKKIKNQYGFDEDYWHDCRFFAGPRVETHSNYDSNSFFYLGMENQLVIIPGYGMPGVSSMWENKPLFVEYNLGVTIGKKGINEFEMFAKSVFFGYFSQNIRTNDADALDDTVPSVLDDLDNDDRVGYSFFLGAATAFDVTRRSPLKFPGYEEEEELGVPGLPDLADKYCIINLFGPTFDLALFQKDLKVRLVADAYGDFAMIHSHAFKKYSQLYDFGQAKSTLNQGYYYALGVTLSSILQVNYSNLEFRGKLKYHYFDSIEGMDRFQKDLAYKDDFDLKDQRFSYNLSLGYRIPNTTVQLVLGLEQMKRWGSIEDFSQRSTGRRLYFQIKYIF